MNWGMEGDAGVAVSPGGAAGADLFRRLRSLSMGGAVLHVGAHPDDEDAPLIAYLARRHGVRTVYWSATRGEGGANRIGPERGNELGVLRTWETLAARAIDGGEALFGPFYDFGFSKTASEALGRWGRRDVVRELVRAIRLVQPQVVVSRWSGQDTDGHGQHQAIGVAVVEAMAAGGDADAFPELRSDGLVPWQPLKLYSAVEADWQPGEAGASGRPVEAHDAAGFLRVDFGAFDDLTGMTFWELGALAHSRHLSQGLVVVPERGPFFAYYRREPGATTEAPRETSFFDGLDPGLTGLTAHPGLESAALQAGLRAVCDDVARAVAAYRPDDAARAATPLLEGRTRITELLHRLDDLRLDEDATAAVRGYLTRRGDAFDAVAARCLGVSAECLADRRVITPAEGLRVRTRVWSPHLPIRSARVHLDVPDGWSTRRASDAVPDERSAATIDDIEVPHDAGLSGPYWLRQQQEPYRYVWPDESSTLGRPFDEPLVTARCDLEVGGHAVRFRVPATHREAYAGGVRESPLAVLPPLALRPRRRRVLLLATGGTHRLELDVEVRNLRAGPTVGQVHLAVPAGWRAHPAAVTVSFDKVGQTRTVRFTVDGPPGATGVHEMAFEADIGGLRFDATAEPIRWAGPDTPAAADVTNWYAEVSVVSPAVVSVHGIPARFPDSLRYASIRGADEDIFGALDGCGLDVTELHDDDLAYTDLGAFDTIVVGPNAYVTRQAVSQAGPRLLDYVRAGGTLVVQNQGYDFEHLGAAPFPFRFSHPHDRVTAPDAPVKVLRPDHPLLQTPNAIGPEDFAGWVQERGRYFFGKWDEQYVPLLAAADADEPDKLGGLLVAGHGHGTYVYVGYSLGRQVAAGVAGGVRLFANLLGLPETRIRERMIHARTVPLLASLADAQLYEVARSMTQWRLHEGDLLCRQGDPGDSLFLVVEGHVEVVKQSTGGERLLHVAGPGEVLGELALLANAPRQASLRARGTVDVLLLEADAFDRLLDQEPAIARFLLRTVAGRLASGDAG